MAICKYVPWALQVIPYENNIIFATHGHVHNANALPPLKKGDVLLHGHTHLTVCENLGDVTYINPGSISLPKDGNNGYIIYENGKFIFKNVNGEIVKEFNM